MHLKLAFLISCLLVATLSEMAQADDISVQDLAGTWEVVSVDRDGEHRHGEVGQEPGDVITIQLQEDAELGINPDVKNLFEGRLNDASPPEGKQPNKIAASEVWPDGKPGFDVVFS